jgi:hypothetical protein
MKFLVNNVDGTVIGGFKSYTNKPISGHYLVNVDYDDFVFDASVNNVSSLISQKQAKYLSEVSNNVFTGSTYVSDEFISGTPINTTYSTYYTSGPNKRTLLRPGGTLYIGDPLYTFAVNPTQLYLISSFYKYTQGTQALKYGAYNLEVDTLVNPADISFRVFNTGAPPTLEISLTPGLNTYAGAFFGNFYLAITNNSLTDTFVLSDFYLYWI